MPAKRYVVATVEGEFPSRPAHNYPTMLKALETCRKGWPDKEWKVFELECVSKQINVSTVSDINVRSNLLNALRDRFGSEFRFI